MYLHYYIRFVAIILLFTVSACGNPEPLSLLPDYVDVVDVKDTALPTKNLIDYTQNQNSLLFFYSADCPFCKQQIKYYKEKYNHLKNFQVILLSTRGTAEAINFQQEHGIDSLAKIQHLIDKNQDLWKFAGANSVPYNIIVNKNGEILLQQAGILTIGTVDNLFKL